MIEIHQKKSDVKALQMRFYGWAQTKSCRKRLIKLKEALQTNKVQRKNINRTENNIKCKQNEISRENVNQEIYLRKEYTIITHNRKTFHSQFENKKGFGTTDEV